MTFLDCKVARSSDREAWLAARRGGVTATEVARAATNAGFREALVRRDAEARGVDVPVEVNSFMQFGTDQEPVIAQWVADNFGIAHNDWLIHHPENKLYLATPDGVSSVNGELVISEIKTTGKDYDGAHIPIAHRRQIQWQMFVVGPECRRALYVWQLRVDDGAGWFYPGWFEPRTQWVERDDVMIAELQKVADLLLTDYDNWVDTDHEEGN
jgi:predicted phage-related endonuclease